MSFVKLDRSLLSSSLWIEGDAEIVRVWVFLLLSADQDGTVRETLPAIAYACKLSIERTEEILAAFAKPDRHSRTAAEGGRRIVIIREPEWAISLVNYSKYRAKRDPEIRRQQVREAVQRHRDRRKKGVSRGKPRKAQAEEEEEAEAEAENNNNGNGERPPAAPPAGTKRTRPRPTVTPETLAAIEKFDRAFKMATGRRASLAPARYGDFAARLAEGHPVEFIVGLPVGWVATAVPDAERLKSVRPDFLLRDGSKIYRRDGETRPQHDWIGSIWSQLDRVRLTPEQEGVLAELGVLDWWVARGAAVAQEAQTW